ncbi:hypothetical protein HDU77_006820 [Chytriomyces hyalinus]|nr:hypothetical protein HDU77_006820 [Chytriomyces hyalinus]
MNSIVTASQFADGTITATLILNDKYISSLPSTLFNNTTTRDQQQQQQQQQQTQSSFTVSVTFSNATGDTAPLCSARATVGPVLWDTCPMELGGSTCMRVSCQSMPGPTMSAVSETVKAVFSVCPSAAKSVDECGVADAAVVRVVKRLGAASSGAVVAAAGTVITGATNIATTSAAITTNDITTSAASAKEKSTTSDGTQTEGVKNATMSTVTSTGPNMVASVVGGGGVVSTKGNDQAPNLALIIVPALVVLAAIAVGVHLFLKRRAAAALDVDVDAEERGQSSGFARRKGSTNKKDAFQGPTAPELSQEVQKQTYFQNTNTAALTMPENEGSTIEPNAVISVSTKQVRLQNLPAGQVRYMRGAPGPILIPGPPAMSPSNESPTSILGLAATYSLGRTAGHLHQGYAPNPNIPSAAAPVPRVPARANDKYAGYYD